MFDTQSNSPAGSALTPAQRWVISMGAILRLINDNDFDTLAGGARGAGGGAVTLCEWWRVRTREEILAQLTALTGELAESLTAEERSARVQSFAWDRMRASNVSVWGYDAGLLSAEEAWSYMLLAARALQGAYGSFRELGEAYLYGRIEWQEKDPSAIASDSTTATINALLRPDGVWGTLRWETSLEDVPVPEERYHTERALPGEAVEAAIERAHARGIDFKRTVLRVELEAGKYPISLDVKGSIEIVGLSDGVILQCVDGASAIRMEEVHSGALFQNVELRAGNDEQVLLSLFNVEGGFLRLDRCVLRGEGMGLDVINGDSFALVTDCTFDSLPHAMRVNGCHVEIARTKLLNIGDLAIEVIGSGSVHLVDCALSDLADRGLRVEGEAALERTSIQRVKHEAIACEPGATVELTRCTLTDGETAALIVTSGAVSVVAKDCVFRGFAAHALQLEPTGKGVMLLRCSFEDSRGHALTVLAGGKVWVVDSSFKGFGHAPLFVKGLGFDVSWEQSVLLERCVIHGSELGGVLVVHGGAATLVDVRIYGCQAAGVESQGGRVRALRCQIDGCNENAVKLHEGAFAILVECRLGPTDESTIVLDASSAQLERCVLREGARALVLDNESRVDALDLTVEETTEHCAVLLANRSIGRFRGGSIREHAGVALRLQQGSAGVFQDVRILDGGVQVDGSWARFDDCAVSGCRGPAILLARQSYGVIQGGDISDSGEALIEVFEDASVRIVGSRLRQRAGQSSVVAHNRGVAVLVGGSSMGGADFSLVAKSGGQILSCGAEIPREDRERIVQSEGIVREALLSEAPDFGGEATWQRLEAFCTGEIAPDPLPNGEDADGDADEEADDGSDGDADEGSDEDAEEEDEVPVH